MSVKVSKPDDFQDRDPAEARDEHDTPRGLSVRCPDCGSQRVWRNGFRKMSNGERIQTYMCAECYRKFTDPSNNSKRSLNGQVADSHNFSEPMDVKDLNSSNGYPTSRDEDLGGAGSRSDMGGGLALEKPLEADKQPAGGTETPQGLLASFGMWLLKQGRSEKTIKTYINYLKVLEEKGVDLADPEKIKEFLAKTDFSINTKNTIAAVYTAFLRFIGGSWDKPSFKPVEKIPFIPTEEELDQLIAGSGRKMAALLQSLKETGMRIGEALRLKWTDVDFERRVVSITPEKGSRARMLPISERLVEMFNSLPKKSERVFPTSDASVKLTFFRVRKKTAKKLGNPRLLKITFHTFRHWKATMEYHKTKDIIHVKELLGHRRIDNTMLYISIEKSLFQYKNDEFYCKTASTVEEASKLIEAGFDYVTTFNGVMMFRKRK